jgi:hypothetical protein
MMGHPLICGWELTGKSDGKNKNNSKEAAGAEMLFG